MDNFKKDIGLQFSKIMESQGIDISIVEQLTDIAYECVLKETGPIYEEVKSIQDKISETCSDFASSLDHEAVEAAKLELDEVIKYTEEATDDILDRIEHIQDVIKNQGTPELEQNIMEDVNKIFEACNYQDLTGQRIKKVIKTLQFIDQTVGGLLSNALSKHVKSSPKSDPQSDEALMNGPQSDAPNQDDIDKLFDSA
tara:strand:+ start:600 stop:1193 length:594 start_codon:yes stop_codon:yes gene_type:complete